MASFTIPFDVSGNYTFDSSVLEVTGGLSQLKKLVDSTGLVAWYKLSDNAGNSTIVESVASQDGTLNDSSNSPANTSLVSITGLVSPYGFNLNKLYKITAPSFSGNEMVGNYTFSAWFKFNNTFQTGSPVLERLANKGDGTGGYDMNFQTSDGKLDISTNSGTGWVVASTDQSVWTAGVLYHIAITWDGATRHVYINGVEDANFPDSNGAIAQSTVQLNLFSHPGTGTTRLFDGIVDDIRFYSRAMSLTEVQAMYNSGSGINEYDDYYDPNDPTIFTTAGNSTPNVVNWSNFVVTAGVGNEGSLAYQLSNNGTDWYYWNGSSWGLVGAGNYNTESVINTNISTFATTGEKLYVKTFLISDGSQAGSIDLISVSYVDNVAPSLDAGTNKTAYANETISPFSDCSFSDADGTVDKIEYKIIGEVDTWTEITQGAYGTLLEAVQAFTYNFDNTGTITASLRATDDQSATTEDSLTVTVSKVTVTINILDADTSLHLSSVSFNAGDGTGVQSVDSPYSHDYSLGTFSMNFVKSGYFSVIQDIIITGITADQNINMSPESGILVPVEKINIALDTAPKKIKFNYT